MLDILHIAPTIGPCFTLGVWNNASVASYLLAKEFKRDGVQISTELSKCIRLCLQHFVLLTVDPAACGTEGLCHKNPMFIGLASMVIHSWEDYGKISAKVPFRSVDDFPPSELCELHELAPAARPRAT
jgi:hypothetical protein